MSVYVGMVKAEHCTLYLHASLLAKICTKFILTGTLGIIGWTTESQYCSQAQQWSHVHYNTLFIIHS